MTLKKDIGLIVLGFFLTIILQNTVGEPFTDLLFPPKLNMTLEPMQNPVFIDGDYYARFYIKNKGGISLHGINAQYDFLCNDVEKKVAFIGQSNLEPGEETFFDVPFQEQQLNYSCSADAGVVLTFYKDKAGRLYCASDPVNESVCIFCTTSITLTSNEFASVLNYTVLYPFAPGELELSISKGCYPEAQLKALNLTKTDNTIRLKTLGIWEYCARGTLPLDWCKEQGYI